ncbi:hypothetical protein SAMN05216228_102433 [Rhizobium tibeticum]|uniref:Uncharacterized protein n=1 Tax=Rhizobium tibeticum TaxID=501024 RepID=A0A1H8SC50_9HYPH|nr:hypothetical protein RTCCBAU85039_4770 [Rhizobium tibeticum]SEO76155.1 hypothetical protein SAMN05216228_102433 [Rhizobium tibeticum]
MPIRERKTHAARITFMDIAPSFSAESVCRPVAGQYPLWVIRDRGASAALTDLKLCARILSKLIP